MCVCVRVCVDRVKDSESKKQRTEKEYTQEKRYIFKTENTDSDGEWGLSSLYVVVRCLICKKFISMIILGVLGLFTRNDTVGLNT